MNGTLLALTLLGCNPDQGEDLPKIPERQEVQQSIQKVSLGNVDFVFEPDSGFTEAEKITLRGHMGAAYTRLSQTLGSDVMQFLKPTEIKVYKTDHKKARGQVKYEKTEVKLTDELKPKLQGDSLGRIDLYIGEISEPNVAHEFAHLFAQGAYFWSEAFSEGMIYGLIHYLYPNYYTSLPDFHLGMVRQKCVAALFDQGWDYDQADIEFGKGVTKDLQKLLHSQWAVAWGDFIAKHPDFPKRFSALLLEERKKGRVDFSRDELWGIAKRAEPDFEIWQASQGASVRPIEAQDAFFMMQTGVEQFFLVNFIAVPTDTSSGKLRAGFIKQAHKGQSTLMSPTDQPLGDIPTVPFGTFNIPRIPDLPSHSVAIGGTKVPFLDNSTCKPLQK